MVTVSHDHAGHKNATNVPGNPQIIRKPGITEVNGTVIKIFPCYHDKYSGKQRGINVIFCLIVYGISICHLGDLGHTLTNKQAVSLGEIDVLLIPLGGYSTIDGEIASAICDEVRPREAVPMHYRTSECGFPLALVEDFLCGRSDAVMTNKCEVTLKASDLPEQQNWVVSPALGRLQNRSV
ncbi:MAG: MBL fold metallo-hydrolase [Chloroflexota bacterium]|nr:MBL fold metallo-hydrolase [Chloroflexota bacterium]